MNNSDTVARSRSIAVITVGTIGMTLALGAFACGSGEPSAPSGGSPGASDPTGEESAFLRQLARDYCNIAATCCKAAQLNPNPSCASTLEAELQVRAHMMKLSGRTEYSQPGAKLCLADIRGMAGYCHEDIGAALLSGPFRMCDAAYLPPMTTNPGDPCEHLEECIWPAAGYAICDFSTYTCVQHVQVSDGQSCGATSPAEVHICGDSSRCDTPAGALTGTCVPLPREGEPCGDRCAPGFKCSWEGDVGTCEASPSLASHGEPCADSVDCETQHCDVQLGVCVVQDTAGSLGDACHNATDCVSQLCEGDEPVTGDGGLCGPLNPEDSPLLDPNTCLGTSG